jgi:glycosyltransferase involved in cell wall biosynthesis
MRLLIVTQKVDQDDQNLGFFHRWIIEFAKQCESVIVICLEKGPHELPANVKVLSLGKESNASRGRYLFNFYRYIFQERKHYDAVFVHMNPIYVVLGGALWNMLGKKISLWYTHKSVDWKLRIAEKFTYRIFTASKESFRLASKKVKVVGHGIDIDSFVPSPETGQQGNRVLSVGRISSTKNQLVMIQAFEIARSHGYQGTLSIVGDAITTDDATYKKTLEEYVRSHNLQQDVFFKGSVRPRDVISVYQQADIFINLSSTGSLDKAVLEAMACGLKILTSNDAFKNILDAENLTDGTPADIATKIRILSTRPATSRWREYVVNNHSLVSLIGHLAEELVESYQ